MTEGYDITKAIRHRSLRADLLTASEAEAQRLLQTARQELDDLIVLSLWAVFESLVFDHLGQARGRLLRYHRSTFTQNLLEQALHGSAQVTPRVAYERLTPFLLQAGVC